MPAPAENGAASINQRTGGLRNPRITARTAATGPTSRCGENPRSCMNRIATTIVTPSMAARIT